MKGFVIDVQKCTGCYACQIACKDEHFGNTWMPYAQEQPEVGQFWIKVNEKERGRRPHVRVSYTPVIGAQTDAIREFAPEVLQDREDGLIVIDLMISTLTEPSSLTQRAGSTIAIFRRSSSPVPFTIPKPRRSSKAQLW